MYDIHMWPHWWWYGSVCHIPPLKVSILPLHSQCFVSFIYIFKKDHSDCYYYCEKWEAARRQLEGWCINRESDAAYSMVAWNEPHINDKMMPFSLENLFDEAVIIINSIKSQPLGMGVLKQTDKFRILHAAVKWLSWGKTLCYWAMSCQSHFFSWCTIWYLKELLIDKRRLFRFEYLAGIALKMDEVSLSLQVTQLLVFVANNNIWACK